MKPRRELVRLLPMCLGVLVLFTAVGLFAFRKELCIGLYTHKLQREPEYLQEAMRSIKSLGMFEALSRYAEDSQCRVRVMVSCLGQVADGTVFLFDAEIDKAVIVFYKRGDELHAVMKREAWGPSRKFNVVNVAKVCDEPLVLFFHLLERLPEGEIALGEWDKLHLLKQSSKGILERYWEIETGQPGRPFRYEAHSLKGTPVLPWGCLIYRQVVKPRPPG